jgi:hypothetical protein
VTRRAATSVLTFLTLLAPSARAAAPTLDYLFPAGGQRGTTVAVTAGGKFEKWPVQVWTDSQALKAQAGTASGTISIEIGKDAAPGPHLLRLYNGEGASALRVFMIGIEREAAEAEPNDELAKAQALDALPVVVNGRLEKSGDVDSFAVKLEAGQCLTASVQGRRLGAPMDPMLHLHDATGTQVAFAHDGLGLDPVLVFRAERTGPYVLRISAFAHPPAADVKLAGAAADVYRLSLTAGLPVRYAFPAGVRRGTKGSVQLHTWGSDTASPVEVDATGADADEAFVTVPAPGADGTVRIELDDGQELTEPQVAGASASQALSPPCAVTGRIEKEGEEDAFRLSAKKGERLSLAARSVALASPMDPVLRVEDESGKSLASDDDAGATPPGPNGGDARLQWEAPADGVYRAVVTDLQRRGGPEYVYRLSIRKPGPSVAATADADEYKVAPGKTTAIKLAVVRSNGHASGLVAVATGLPAGVTATAVEVPEKGGEVAVTLSAAADAKPASGPVRVMLLGTDPDHPSAVIARASLKKEAGQEFIATTDSLWLTVLAAAPAK